ncbi:MAG: hypothetical protein DRQ99_27010, partial [Candidatus Parabeggiatoa sp. nov. 3]
NYCAIFTTYHRQQNIDLVLRSLIKCKSIRKVIVINANPDCPIEQCMEKYPIDIDIIQTHEPKRPGYRWYIARNYQTEYDRFIALDDDTLLSPKQLHLLVTALERTPSAPQGIIGSRYPLKPYCYDQKEQKSITEFYKSHDAIVDVIHQAYVVTGKHVSNFHRIANKLTSYDVMSPTSIGDDIIISHSGTEPPQINAVGRILECPFSHFSGIAVHTEHNAERRRCKVIREIWDKKLCEW